MNLQTKIFHPRCLQLCIGYSQRQKLRHQQYFTRNTAPVTSNEAGILAAATTRIALLTNSSNSRTKFSRHRSKQEFMPACRLPGRIEDSREEVVANKRESSSSRRSKPKCTGPKRLCRRKVAVAVVESNEKKCPHRSRSRENQATIRKTVSNNNDAPHQAGAIIRSFVSKRLSFANNMDRRKNAACAVQAVFRGYRGRCHARQQWLLKRLQEIERGKTTELKRIESQKQNEKRRHFDSIGLKAQALTDKWTSNSETVARLIPQVRAAREEHVRLSKLLIDTKQTNKRLATKNNSLLVASSNCERRLNCVERHGLQLCSVAYTLNRCLQHTSIMNKISIAKVAGQRTAVGCVSEREQSNNSKVTCIMNTLQQGIYEDELL